LCSVNRILTEHDGAFFASLDYTDINLALNKPALQPSTWEGHSATQAVDGNPDTQSCTHGHDHPWLSIDLGAPYDVGHVTITNDAHPSYGNYRRTHCTSS